MELILNTSLMFVMYLLVFPQEIYRLIGFEKLEILEHNKRVTKMIWDFMLDNYNACIDCNYKLNRIELLMMTRDHFSINLNNPDLFDWMYDMTGKFK